MAHIRAKRYFTVIFVCLSYEESFSYSYVMLSMSMYITVDMTNMSISRVSDVSPPMCSAEVMQKDPFRL